MSICLNATNSGAADGCFGDYASMGGNDPVYTACLPQLATHQR
jgi:hypothetical protein